MRSEPDNQAAAVYLLQRLAEFDATNIDESVEDAGTELRESFVAGELASALGLPAASLRKEADRLLTVLTEVDGESQTHAVENILGSLSEADCSAN